MKQEKKAKVQKLYYYQVIPLTRLPLLKDNKFTYHSLTKVPPGSVVEIIFSHKKIRGIIYKKTQAPKFKTLPIQKIITPEQITPQQFKLAQKISSYYLTPLSTVLKFFAFPLTKKENQNYFAKIEKLLQKTKLSRQKIQLTLPQKKAVQKITENQSKNFLLFGPPSSGKTEVIGRITEKAVARGEQVLLLLPEIFLSYQEIIRYSLNFFPHLKTKIAILHSQLTSSEITTIWRQVQSGQIKVVIGTRMSIFLPFKNLSTIVIDEEQDESHKQWDTPPFYHVRELSLFLQEIIKHQRNKKLSLILSSSTPSLESYQLAKKSKNWQIIELPRLKTSSLTVRRPEIKLVDLKKYFQSKKQIIISPELRSSLEKILKNNKLAFILVPRRGKSSAVLCQDCQEMPFCPDCQTPLIHSRNHYRCLHCNFKISDFSKCPHCGSFRLQDMGFGTEAVADTLKTLFPTGKILVADQSTFQDDKHRQKIILQLQNNEIDFLVGTYALAKGLDLPQVELVAVPNADNWPGQQGFRFDERYLSALMQLSGRVNRPGSSQKGVSLIQTFNPTNRIFNYLISFDWLSFLKYELQNRASLNYPPFTHLVKISYKNKSRQKTDDEVEKVYQKLKNALRKKNLKIQILEPYYGQRQKSGKYWQKNILLKIRKLPLQEKKLLEILDLPSGWKIDVDPYNIF